MMTKLIIVDLTYQKDKTTDISRNKGKRSENKKTYKKNIKNENCLFKLS